MITSICERAVEDAVQTGRAILTHIHPNDIEDTMSKVGSFYLPKPVYNLYTDIQPVEGNTCKRAVTVEWWQLGLTIDLNVTWCGRETRCEYRLTGFGENFPFLKQDCIGDLLVLVPHNYHEFAAYVLDSEEDIEEIYAILGLDILQSWSAYYKRTTVAVGELDEQSHSQI